MSASKEHFGPSGRTHWRDASRAFRCPVCGHDSWCQIGSGARAGTVLCKRVESARERTNREGVPYWVHACDPSAVPPSVSEVVSKSALSIATDEVRDQAYRAILDALGLSPAHRELLRARGLSEREIEQGQYCTLEVRGRAALARRAADAVGKFAVAGVPGIVWEARTERGWWTLKGAAGLVIPSRNVRGQIVALKVRSESPEGSRYTSVSSRSAGGPASACNVHFPRQTSARFASKRVLWITEGELKADAAAALSDWAIVGLPGVSMWRGAVALAHELGARRVVVALDADWKTKPEVQTARTDLVRALERSGLSVHAVDWPIALGKGLDDYLLGLREHQTDLAKGHAA